MRLVQRDRGISVNSYLATHKKQEIQAINGSYFWITAGRYWPVGLVRSGGKDKTSFLVKNRGYAYFEHQRFHLSWKLPDREAKEVYQGHLIVFDGKVVLNNGGFNQSHWRRHCPRSIVVIRRDKWGVEYVGLVRARGSLRQIAHYLIKQRVITAMNNDGDLSSSQDARVANILVIEQARTTGRTKFSLANNKPTR